MKLPGRQISKNSQNYDVKLLQRALGKLKFNMSEEERQLGLFSSSTAQAVTDFQKRHRLPQTGDLDSPTLAKLAEAMSEREANKRVPPKAELLKVDNVKEVARIRYPLRHNMARNAVESLQKTLAYLKLEIDAAEAAQQRFGASTVAAVKQFQLREGLEPTGEVDRKTAAKLNERLAPVNPAAAAGSGAFRIRGSARDEAWKGMSGVKVQIVEQLLRGERVLGERQSLANGFFDLKYNPPKEGKPDRPIMVRFVAPDGKVLKSERLSSLGRTRWVNYTEGPAPYGGSSELEKLVGLLKPELGGIAIGQLEESPANRDLTYLAKHLGKPADELMKLALSYRMSDLSGVAADVLYAFVKQNLPAGLPGALIESTQQWQLVERLADQTLTGIAFMEPELQKDAISSAVAANLVPRSLLARLDTALAELRRLKLHYTLEKAMLPGNASLSSVLRQSKLPSSGYGRFSELYDQHRGAGAKLWASLEEEPSLFAPQVVNDLKKTFAVAAIAKNHTPIVQYLKEAYADPRELAKLGHEQWVAHIRANIGEGRQGYPSSMDGADDAEKIQVYASILRNKAQAAYPTVAVTAAASSGAKPLAHGAQLQALVDQYPEFDLRKTRIDRFLKDKKGELSLGAEAVAELKVLQRAFKNAGDADAAVALYDRNLHSAAHIYFQGRKRFSDKFTKEGKFTRLEARRVYDRAARNYAMLLTQVGELHNGFGQLAPQAVQSWQATPEQRELIREFPSLEALFGSLDYCGCSDCRSLYSPAAYLVDMLRFLGDKDAGTPGTADAKEALLRRRGDLGGMLLSCDNTNTPLPYIDLVNELLEEAVAPPAPFVPFALDAAHLPLLENRRTTAALRGVFSPPLTASAVIDTEERGSRWIITEPAYRYVVKREDDGVLRVLSRSRQTTGTAAELAANPQYVNAEAYGKLAKALYPWTLPFRLWREEQHIYLRHLGTSRVQLAETLSPAADRAAVLNDAAVARETLGLSPIAWAIVAREGGTVEGVNLSAAAPWHYWGFDGEQASIADPADPDTIISGKWYQVLSRVDILLRRAGLAGSARVAGGSSVGGDGDPNGNGGAGGGYAALLGVLDTRYVNPASALGPAGRQLSTVSLDPAEPLTCTLGKLALRAHGATPAESEALLIAALDRMHRLMRLSAATGYSPAELDRAMTALMTSDGLDSGFLLRLSHVRRLQRERNIPLDVLLSWWSNLDTAVYRGSGGHKPEMPLYDRLFRNKTILHTPDEAFQLNEERTGLLRPHTPGDPVPLTGHKPALLAALGLTEGELGTLMRRSGVADEMTLANLSKLYRHVSMARQLKLTIHDYWSARELAGGDPFAFPDTAAVILFMEAADRLRGSGFALADLDWLLRDKRGAETALASPEGGIAAVLTELRAELRKIADGKPAAEDAAESDSAAEQAPHTRRALSEAAIIRKLADALSLERSTAELLLTRHAPSSAGAAGDPVPPSRAIDEFLATPLLDSGTDISPAAFPAIFRTYVRLEKAAALIGRWKLGADVARAVMEHADAAGWLHPGRLPAPASGVAAGGELPDGGGQDDGDEDENGGPGAPGVGSTASGVLLEPWLKLQALIEARDVMGLTDARLLELLKAAFVPDGAGQAAHATAKRAFQETLTAATGWPAADIVQLLGAPEALADTGLLAAVFPGDYRKPGTWLRLQRAMSLSRKLGVAPLTVKDWAGENPGPVEAAAVKQAAKAKYDERTWPSLARTLRDPLRERQRDALAAYLLARPALHPSGRPLWESASGLYAHLLIDVEMSALQMTTRLKQAISSVQLFVQRCLMNLESREVTVREEDDWEQWQWMKNYRVWEANRKVFLYPENWTEPELRSDKSPFFKELEDELARHEITQDHAESAYLLYLEKLDEVARLEICSMYQETEGDSVIVHVLARTKASPAVYYYRKLMNDSYWTGWEKLDLEIDSEHATLAVHNRKLHVFWPVFTEKLPRRQTQPPAVANSSSQRAPEAPKYWEIQLAWSVLRSGAWMPQKQSKRKLIHPWERPKTAYLIKPRPRGGYLWIDVFISTSPEFNDDDALFYYPEEHKWAKKTATPHNETLRPWHSSSFVFNGDVTDVYMKNIRVPSTRQGSLIDLVQRHYGEEGRLIRPLGHYERMPQQLLPAGMHYRNERLVNNTRHWNADDLNVVANGGQRVDNGKVLDSANAPFSLVITQQDAQFDSASRPFFYQDHNRAFFIRPTVEYRDGISFTTNPPSDPATAHFRVRYTLYPFYHPYTTLFIRELHRSGLPGLLSRKVQTAPQSIPPGNAFDFETEYRPVEPAVPAAWEDPAETGREIVDFSADGAYALYNWELFFHAPLMIATSLSRNQRFEEAMRWFHFIFDPTSTDNGSVPQKYWKTKPFYNYSESDYRNQRIDNLLKLVNAGSREQEVQVELWRSNPFNPHLVARLRPVAYQRNVVMKYIDNLIAWGDQLFRRDTLETINEATLLYVLASEILGRRPERLPSARSVRDMSYEELERNYIDPLGNAMAEVEGLLPPVPATGQPGVGAAEQLPRLEMFYFGIPHNDKLLEYWNTVEDRLFKIRHSLNIDGKFRQLPLFEPPIDPGLLVKAAAAGVDIASALNDMSAPHPHYRFPVMLQKAQQLAGEVKSLGAQLLSVLEKRDAETLSLLRASQETKLLERIAEVKEKLVEEQQALLQGLEKSRESVQQKLTYYSNLQYMNTWEIVSLSLSGASTIMDTAIAAGYILAGGLKLIPSFVIGASGFGGSPTATAELGGQQIGDSAENAVKTMSAISRSLEKMAAMASTMGGYERRKEEWDQQKALAEIELGQVDKQIAAAAIRIEVAAKELGNHRLQTDNAKSAQQFMQSKFTNEELYQWMVGQVSTLYFQSYQLAYDMAKRAEKAYRFELGLRDSSYIGFGYWDSLKKGLLAGEKLAYDLNRLDAAYHEQNGRQLELVKHVSLAQTAPFSLMELKENGSCLVELPEWLFDMDYPGHYMRRLKSVSISVPCVAGPYTGVNCTLSLVSGSIRTSGTAGPAGGGSAGDGGYARTGPDDGRFLDQHGLSQAIATSSGSRDSGMFELSFRDERYLPFEGAGAISLWRIEMPRESNGIDFSTISDIVLHVHYTARDGGAALGAAARSALRNVLPNRGVRIFDLKREFASEWHRFFRPAGTGADAAQELAIILEDKHAPFFDRKRPLKASAIHVIAHCAGDEPYALSVKPPGGTAENVALRKDRQYGEAHHGEKSYVAGQLPPLLGQWLFRLKADAAPDERTLAQADVDGLFAIIQYQYE